VLAPLAEVMRDNEVQSEPVIAKFKEGAVLLESYGDCITKMHYPKVHMSLRCPCSWRNTSAWALFGAHEREHAINNYYLRQFACIRNWCQRMRHIFVNRKLAKSEKVQKELRESSRGPSATLVQRLLRIERPRRIRSMFLKRAFIYLLFHCSRHFCG
jgi:hypothetical protein